MTKTTMRLAEPLAAGVTRRSVRRSREEETEAIEAEIAEKRWDTRCPAAFAYRQGTGRPVSRRAAEAQIPTSALVRRLLWEAIQGQRRESPTLSEIEDIARRVAR